MKLNTLVLLVLACWLGLTPSLLSTATAADAVPSAGPATVRIDWKHVIMVSKTTATLQLVVNPMVRRGSPIHQGTFQALASLNTTLSRYVPWLPYPRLGVAELFAPSRLPQCWIVPDSPGVYFQCPPGQNFEAVEFATFGEPPTGSCGSWEPSTSCMIDVSDQISQWCLPNFGCMVNASSAFWNMSCPNGAQTALSVQLKCSPSSDQTSWNFGLIDPMMEDFMDATEGKSPIINFSTIPEWLWNQLAPIHIPDDPNQVFWTYESGTRLRDPTFQELGDYFQRLVGYFVNGQFTDEYGQVHTAKRKYDIEYWEILNEPNLEHSNSVQYYTQMYDAMTASIRKAAPDMKFVALAMSDRNPDWVQYFLNDSNHQPGYIEPEYISYHFYAGSNRLNATQFEWFFGQAEDFFDQVDKIEAIRKTLKPNMKTTMDEVGVILNGDPDGGPINPEYWAAASGLYAYVLSKMTVAGIDAVGESQLVGYPTQYPSVSMMDWTNGKPNARFWVLKLLTDEFSIGDKLVQTTVTPAMGVYAQARICVDGSRKLLLVNKTVHPVSVHVSDATGAVMKTIDTNSGDNPATITKLQSNVVKLAPYATSVITLP